MSTPPDVLVLRTGTHGMPVEQYAAAIRERLPDRSVELARTPAAEREAIADARFVTGMTFGEELLEAAAELEVFACAYAGTGHLPLDRLEERGVAVTNASGVHGPNIGEHVLGAILRFTRRFHVGARQQRNREWRHYQAHELQGSTVTIVGLGAIGEAVAERLEPFGVETIGVRYSPEKGGPTDEVVGFEGEAFHDALSRADYLVLACPLTETTRGLIDEAAFVTMDPDAVLVNVARGPVVDTDDLVSALRSGWIRGASLDVTDPEPLPEEHPLWNFGNVQITPHNAGHTPAYYERLADIVAENARRFDEDPDAELENQVLP
ncbi:D-2-hydroxyacid dehydrogenase [Natronolimnohabitans innermongolicus]|uniref:D-isomer specific 2-hydroxyacid dehydrogenase NAD-binding protein n=1 Tax=Natronolimnohabitans innermongolicus JCM 12255 TaxID=1227499 RepID=L9WLH4_9EURY|nr:D-2-hydroxyacid dehydrogenase [Natronolimnohabitans innermongolicus]ELY49203.1 D-isomer specific 2-hydroxyacid dehydrogenase NAD-binding protein [Natronolimnohabitans innermongolicus JCM 12255]